MEKAIEIKRRAQRFVQSGDVDAALAEYEKLARAEENEPYHSVVIADLLFKKGDHGAAAKRYLTAVDGYEESGLYKNAIAVCKKMARLGLAAGKVFQRLAQLHALDGLSTESGLYYLQHAEYSVRAGDDAEAAVSLRLAFNASSENVIALERLADLNVLSGEIEAAVATLKEAIAQYERVGQLADARRCAARLREVEPGGNAEPDADKPAGDPIARPAAIAEPNAPEAVFELTRREDDLRADEPVIARQAAVVPPSDVALSSLVAAIESFPPDFEPTLRQALSPATAEAPTLHDLDLAVDAGHGNGVPVSPAMSEPVANESVAEMAPARPGLTFASSPADTGSLTEGIRASGDSWLRALMPDAGDDDTLLDLLHQAAECHRAGAPEAAAQLLLRTAQAHDAAGNADGAARVYRTVHDIFAPSKPTLMLWFDNCRRRGDRTEGARVACDLGDEAQRRGDGTGAREWFERAHALDPMQEAANVRLAGLGMHASAPARTSTLVESEPAESAETAKAGGQMPGLTTDPLKIQVTHGMGDHVPMDLLELVETFQSAVRGQVSGDTESHYALGVSYLEMGLVEQAIDSLRSAAEEPSLRARAFELIGRCYMDQGRFEEATVEFRAALDQRGLAADAELNVQFELGIALEAAGRLDEALVEFEKIYGVQPSYPDVALKIRVLRKTLETE